MQHLNKHTCNIPLEKQIKHTYLYNRCNIYDIPIYFCNIRINHLQRTSETSETLKTYACNMCFFLSWCLRLIVGDVVPAGDDLLLEAWCTPWPRWVSAEWGAARDARSSELEEGGTVRDGRNGVG